MAIKDREIFHRVWEGFLNSVGLKDSDDVYQLVNSTSTHPVQKRSMSMARLREQLWYALDEAEGGWAYPIDIFVGDDGSSLFSIVAQSGKLYSVPLTIQQESITLGEWTQVKEEFTPVQQNRFFVRRQQDGSYRWTAIAATSVLNRVGAIDSQKLFDSFIELATKRNKYPRLDFYHYGETDPEVWEFGTADFLARDGVCYLASGLFDEGHPLAEATIRASEAGEDNWGCSIEFYAYVEPEKILIDPEVTVPVYNEGENTRISVVLEEDAAGLFTRLGVKEGVTRTMDKNTRNALEKLFGDNTDGLQEFLDQFEEGVDDVNQRVKNDKLIHRAKVERDVNPKPDDPVKNPDQSEDDTDAEDTEADTDGEDDDDEGLVLDDSAVEAITQQMLQSPEFVAIRQSISDLTDLVKTAVAAQEKRDKEVKQIKQSVERLGQEDAEKQSEWLQDLPARRGKTVSYRPRDAHGAADSEEDADYSAQAARTLEKIKLAY